MTRTVHGRLHGSTIELDEDFGLQEGQIVEVEVRLVGSNEPPHKTRRLGTLRGSVSYMAPDFDAPLDQLKEYMP